MRGNFLIITITGALFGLSFGVYDLVLPLWLKTHGVSYMQMGWIFAASNGVMVVLPILVGWLADHFGRKRFFAAGLGVCAGACLATPMTASVTAQTGLRVMQRAATGIYESLQNVLLFETSRFRFIPSVRVARGFELTCHALGAVLVWFLIRNHTGSGKLALPMYVAFGLLAVAFMLVVIRLREPQNGRAQPFDLRRFSPFGLPRVLILLAAFNFVFMLGLSISHSQMMLLFFYDKFDLAEHHVAWISMAHRMSLGLPMILAVFWTTRPNKRLFVITIVLEGVFVATTVLPTGVWGAVVIWLLHDPVGAAIWLPISSWYMQHYARPDRRAADVAIVMAMSTLGTVIGPILAGQLAEYRGSVPSLFSGAIDLPFFASGVVVVLSAVLVCFLPKAPHDEAVQSA